VRVFVTGATGFIGRHLMKRLVLDGYDIRCLVRQRKAIDFLASQKIEVIQGEVTDRDTVLQGMIGCDALIHLANIYAMWLPDPSEFARVNVDGTRIVMESAAQAIIQRVIYVSTVAVYGHPKDRPFSEDSQPGKQMLSRYGLTKAEANRLTWEIAKMHNMQLTVLYPGIVLGAGDDKASGQYIQDILFQRVPSTIFHRSEAVYVYVEDVVESIIHSLTRPEAIGQRYLIGKESMNGKSYTHLIRDIAGVRLPWFHFPDLIVIAAAYLFTAIAAITRKPPWWGLSIDAAKTLSTGFYYRADKSESELGIRYTPIRYALEEAIQFYRERALTDLPRNADSGEDQQR
jgi:dihydroflavonol-4-reductase